MPIQTSFTDWSGNESLAHYGVQGMKWGQRRFQNPDGSLTSLGKQRYGQYGHRSALGTKHDLNKLDRERATAQARYDYYSGKATRKLAKLNRKLGAAKEAGDEAGAAKIRSKIGKTNAGVGQKAKDYKRLLESNKKLTDRIINESIKKGYSIKSRDCLREVNRGRNTASGILAGLSAATLGIGVGTVQYAPGTHYRVKNDGLGTRTHRSRRWRTYANS